MLGVIRRYIVVVLVLLRCLGALSIVYDVGLYRVGVKNRYCVYIAEVADEFSSVRGEFEIADTGCGCGSGAAYAVCRIGRVVLSDYVEDC